VAVELTRDRGGALGGVIESDAAVREGAYAYRADDEGGR
jgi:hypothetical protein